MQNKVPVFCPALTDGSLGDMLYFHSYKRGGFVLDIVGDIRALNDIALAAKKTGVCPTAPALRCCVLRLAALCWLSCFVLAELLCAALSCAELR
jgi:hypothetical protein